MTRSPGFQLRTAEPTRSTTPDGVGADDVERLVVARPPTLSLPRRLRNPNVGSGSKIDVHTVLKLIELAITAMYASSGASSGSGHVVDVQRLARVLVGRVEALEHRPARRGDEGRSVGLGNAESGDVVAGRARHDGVEDLLHAAEATARRWRGTTQPPGALVHAETCTTRHT